MSTPTQCSIDPLALLTAHQEARDRGTRLLSVLCGSVAKARALWGQWLASRSDDQGTSISGVVAPGNDVPQVRLSVQFASGAVNTPLLFVPESSQFPQALSTAQQLAQDQPQRPLAVVSEPTAIMDVLQAETSELNTALRGLLIGGLIVLDQHVETVLNRTVLRADERPLYRSDHEQILHKLLQYDAQISETFMINSRVKVSPKKTYEVDLWCSALQLALEVDGSHHVSHARQRIKDAQRDADLAAAGIATIRIHAAEVISDPSQVMAYIRQRIQTRREQKAD